MNGSVFSAALGAASVEFLETAAIAYAIGRSGFPREAWIGTITGFVTVGLGATISGRLLVLVPRSWLQVAVGLLLVWFGAKWAIKSLQRLITGRRAGWIGEDVLVKEHIQLAPQAQGFNWINFLVMAKSAALEALEVALVVVNLGLASQAWAEVLGATAVALVLSGSIVICLHAYLRQIPEVWIKLVSGVLLVSLGTFWFGEGWGWPWWRGDLSIPILVLIYSLLAALVLWRWGHSHPKPR